MTTQTRITMTRVAMRAAVWSFFDAQIQRPHDDSEIDALTHKAVDAVLDVAEQYEREQKQLMSIGA